MQEQYAEYVIPALAQHLGVFPEEIALNQHLFRDWGLTPLSLVVILLDLERTVAIELPPQDLEHVDTVADLVAKFRDWMRARPNDALASVRDSARGSRSALEQRRIRRELHHLRWLEQHSSLRSLRRARALQR
jgi:acyl carrier protein